MLDEDGRYMEVKIDPDTICLVPNQKVFATLNTFSPVGLMEVKESPKINYINEITEKNEIILKAFGDFLLELQNEAAKLGVKYILLQQLTRQDLFSIRVNRQFLRKF